MPSYVLPVFLLPYLRCTGCCVRCRSGVCHVWALAGCQALWRPAPAAPSQAAATPPAVRQQQQQQPHLQQLRQLLLQRQQDLVWT
jgi:hypothetical protein